MRIGIEAQRLFRTNKHGMDKRAIGIIKSLQKIDTVNQYFIFIRPGPDNNVIEETSNFKIVLIRGFSYFDWEQIFLPFKLLRYKLDFVHCTSSTAPVFCPVPIVLTLHDAYWHDKKYINDRHMTLYQKFGNIYRRLIIPIVARRAKKIITVSNTEKTNIVAIIKGVRADKITVIYNALSEMFCPPKSAVDMASTKNEFRLPDNYILFFANTDPRKNTEAALRAYARYCLVDNVPLPMVCTKIDRRKAAQILNNAALGSAIGYISFMDYIPSSHLINIYQGARIFFFPSIYEGFGIPLLEAMACGTPVITSKSSSLPEVAGEAALYVDATNEEEMAESLARLSNDPILAQRLIKKGYERIKDFSYLKSAQQILEIF